jgi:hypothetical protein
LRDRPRGATLGELERAATSIAFRTVFMRLVKVRMSHCPIPHASFPLSVIVVASGPASDWRTSIVASDMFKKPKLLFSTRRCGAMYSKCQSMLATASRQAQAADSRGSSRRNSSDAVLTSTSVPIPESETPRPRGGIAQCGRVPAGPALSFTTWRSLVREQGLTDRDAVELTVALLAGRARAEPDGCRGLGRPGRQVGRWYPARPEGS